MKAKRSSIAASPRRRRATATAPLPPDSEEQLPAGGADLREIALDLIDVPQARLRRDLGPVADLAYSIGSVGLMHPIHVYRSRSRFRLVAGERRLEAVRILGWPRVMAFVRERSDNDLLLELIENTQRKWLTDAEEADALIRLVRTNGFEIREVAAQAGRSEAFVSKRIRVFEDATLRGALERNAFSVSVAEEFLALDPERRRDLVARAIQESWDLGRAREEVRAVLRGAEPEPSLDFIPPADESAWASADSLEDASVVEGDFHEVDGGEGATPEVESSQPGSAARSSEMAQKIRTLDRLLRDMRPYQLTTAEERALADLLRTLLGLARAHTSSGGRSGPVFPSIEEAERRARRR